MSEKQAELASLKAELETLKGAISTSEACKRIAEYVKSHQDQDALVTPDSQNPFVTSVGGTPCQCTIS